MHELPPSMYHPKLLIVDEAWVTIGSANFDERSFRINDEANLNVFGEAFAREQIALFDADLERSRPVTLEQWERRPLRQKIADWFASRLRPRL